MTEPRRLTDPRQLRAMAHPLRLRLFYALQAEGSATASRLAELTGESPSLVSYHLRQLAAHGFIADDPTRDGSARDARERWWTAGERGFSWSESDFAGAPEQAGAAGELKRQMIAHHVERLDAWERERHAWPQQWQDAATMTDGIIDLTADELADLAQELADVVARWRRRTRSADDGAAREHVMVVQHAFPFRP